MQNRLVILGLVAITLWLCAGCRPQQPTEEPAATPTVSVSLPIEREVTEYADYIGRTEAVNTVEIKARVTGYLKETNFEEGSEVKKGQMLCLIDPRTYQAQLDAAQGQLADYKAKYELAKTENERAKSLYADNPKAISLKALDQHQAEENSAAAAVAAAQAQMEVYQLNVDFTKITSPIDGRVGRYEVTVGNLVTENTTTLTTVVSQDPVYVYFNVDEPTMLKAVRQFYQGELPPLNKGKVQVGMQLQDEQGFPHAGTIDFADNVVDPSTGTITVRASFENPANSNGLRLLMPGLFVRIRLPLGRPESSLLIAEQAIGTDQGQKYVYVVGEKDVVEYRGVTLGQLQPDGLQVIKSGLSKDDQVIVSGLQVAKPKQTVKIDKIPMPTTKPATTEKTQASADDTSGSTPAGN